MISDRLHERFRNGLPAVGTFVNVASPDVVEALGRTGIEFVTIDTEHAPTTLADVGNLIRAAEVTGLVPIVRVPSADAQSIFNVLDAGALGVQVPQVRNVHDVETVARASRYSPFGLRGLAPLRACEYGMALSDEYIQAANKAIVTIVQIESPEAVENLKPIARADGVDIIFGGPLDLSVAMGVPGKTDHPKVLAILDRILKETKAAGKVAGIAVSSIDEASAYIEKGFQFITVGSDLSFIIKQARLLADFARRFSLEGSHVT